MTPAAGLRRSAPGLAGRESPLPDAEGCPPSPPRRLSGVHYLQISQRPRQRERAHPSAHRTAAALHGSAVPARRPITWRGTGLGAIPWPHCLPPGPLRGRSPGQS